MSERRRRRWRKVEGRTGGRRSGAKSKASPKATEAYEVVSVAC